MSYPRIPRVRPRAGRVKRCRGRCGELLSVLHFARDRARADGRRSVCRDCKREREEELALGAERHRPWWSVMSLRKHALEHGVPESTVRGRVARGMSVLEAVGVYD